MPEIGELESVAMHQDNLTACYRGPPLGAAPSIGQRTKAKTHKSMTFNNGTRASKDHAPEYPALLTIRQQGTITTTR